MSLVNKWLTINAGTEVGELKWPMKSLESLFLVLMRSMVLTRMQVMPVRLAVKEAAVVAEGVAAAVDVTEEVVGVIIR
ncbi:hypothetical protein [Pseudomonas antarctica]|nr:hypothetical protein [Pseudomonas antarctica]